MGTIEEFKRILSFYGEDLIRTEIRNVGYLDPKTFEFALSFFNLKKEEMRCYIKKQSQPDPWI